eukprot:3775513-Alexandrium_andersonii.AAC.1
MATRAPALHRAPPASTGRLRKDGKPDSTRAGRKAWRRPKASAALPRRVLLRGPCLPSLEHQARR